MLVLLFQCFASIPISIRQKDWKVSVLPFLSALFIILVGIGGEYKSDSAWKFVGWTTQAAFCALLVKQNRDEAEDELNQAES